MTIPFKEYRCTACHKLLFKGWLVESAIEIKCKGCHEMNTIEASSADAFMCGILPCPNRIPVQPKKH